MLVYNCYITGMPIIKLPLIGDISFSSVFSIFLMSYDIVVVAVWGLHKYFAEASTFDHPELLVDSNHHNVVFSAYPPRSWQDQFDNQ